MAICNLHLLRSSEVQVLKLKVDSDSDEPFQIDISVNQIGGIFMLDFMQGCKEVFGSLLVQSISLVKAYLSQDCNLMGSHSACLTSASVNVLILNTLLNNSVQSPMDCFFELFSFLQKQGQLEDLVFNVATKCYTEEYQAFPESALNSHKFSLIFEKEKTYTIARQKLANCQSESLRNLVSRKACQLKNLNILDPTTPNNNLGKSISSCNFSRLELCIEYTAEKIVKLKDLREQIIQSNKSAEALYARKLVKLFGDSLQMQDLIEKPARKGLVIKQEEEKKKLCYPIYMGIESVLGQLTLE